MNVIVQVNGQEAIPVRAIAFVTGQDISPPEVAEWLARAGSMAWLAGTSKNAKGARLTAYERSVDRDVVRIPPKQWDAIATDLREMEETHGAEDSTESRRIKSLQRMPAAVFVWKDAFQRAFASVNRENREHYTMLPIRLGKHAPSFTPLIPEGAGAIVLDGFPAAPQTDRNLRDGERDKLLMHIGALALTLSENLPRYKSDGNPNVSRIAASAIAVLDGLPNLRKRGLGSSSIRESISEGIKLLRE